MVTLLCFLCFLCALALGLYLSMLLNTPFVELETAEKHIAYSGQVAALKQFRFVNTDIPMIVNHPIQESVISMLSVVTQVLRKAEVTHWATGTTLHACVTTGNLFPWEDCAHLAVWFSHQQHRRLVSTRPVLKEIGLELVKNKHSYRIFSSRTSYPYIEVWLFMPKEGTVSVNPSGYTSTGTGDEIVVCTPLDELNEPTFADSYVHRRLAIADGDLLPLDLKDFSGTQLPVPHKAVSYMQRVYGEDLYRVHKTTSHIDNGWVRSGDVQVSDGMKVSGPEGG